MNREIGCDAHVMLSPAAAAAASLCCAICSLTLLMLIPLAAMTLKRPARASHLDAVARRLIFGTSRTSVVSRARLWNSWPPEVTVRGSCIFEGTFLNNFIHHKSGSNEYKDKRTNITKLTLSSTYINRNIMVNHIRMCLQTELSTELYDAKNLVFNLLNRTLGLIQI